MTQTSGHVTDLKNVLETHNQEPNLIQTRLAITFSTPSKQQSEPSRAKQLAHRKKREV